MFRVALTRTAIGHLRHLPKAVEVRLFSAMEQHLVHEPTVPSASRKLLRPNSLAEWELRVGDYRIFYDVDAKASEVVVRAVGMKKHNVLRIAGKEFEL